MLNVVLDIDNTLVDTHTEQIGSMQAPRINGTDFYVYKRPHLDSFLNWLFDNFTVSLWTAGSDTYAAWIAKHVVGTRNGKTLRHVLSSRDCQMSLNMYGTPKSLRYLNQIDPSMGLDNTLLVDDTPSNFVHQQQNGVLVRPFNVMSEDEELAALPDRIIKQFYNLARHL